MSASNTLGNNAFFNRLDANNVNFKNHSDYNELLQKIETNTENITTNTNDIATNTSDIATNTSDIATNTSNIATNTSNIATNTSNIATNTSNIETNTSNIATNTSNIATNTSNIETNTSDIATNTSNIATNTSDLSKINELLEFDTVKKRVNPVAPFNNGVISLGYRESNTNNRARFDEIHCKDIIANTSQVNEDIRFYSDGEKVRLDATLSDTNGGSFDIYTKTQNGSLEKKFNINNRGAIGIGTSSSYGTSGQVLTSNGSGSTPSWESDLNVSGTANVTGEFTTQAVTKLYNNRYIFGPDANFEGNLIVDSAQNTLYVDTINHRVGINKVPTEDLDVEGNIQINTSGLGRLIFYDSNDDHEHAEIDGVDDGVDGGALIIKTKEVGNSSVSEKLRINNVGAIGIGGENYGTSGQVLTSNGNGAVPTWNSPYFLKVLLETQDNTGLDDTNNYVIGVDGQQRPLVPQFSIDFDYNNSDWNQTTSVWTCPKKGIYRINAQVALRLNNNADRGRKTLIDIYNNTTIVASNQFELESDSSTSDDFREYNPTINTLLEYDVGETMIMKLSWELWGTGEKMLILPDNGRTFICIEKVS
jgi:hypothetical protein